MVREKLEIQIPTQGWKQLLSGRKKILDAYDSARDQAQIHEVGVHHGRVAEAGFREWLAEFLPKRYGITSGYVVSQGLGSRDKTPHFDVIIYDKLEAPVLWVEDSPDTSEHGRSLAIPVEYVRAVLEVKSRLVVKTVRDALQHLGDLAPVMQGLDDPTERYKRHLPQRFRCGIVFMELLAADASTNNVLTALLDGISLRGFFGGLVLRGEGHTTPQTGRIRLTRSEEASEGNLANETSLLEYGMSSTVRLADKLHIGSVLMWFEHAFAEFGFDLVAMLQGTDQSGLISSFYGYGSSFLEMVAETGGTVETLGASKPLAPTNPKPSPRTAPVGGDSPSEGGDGALLDPREEP